jgi:outer membrane receptor protein involved in Fe transport
MTTLRRLVWITCTVAVTWALAGAIAVAAQSPHPSPDAEDRRPDEIAFRIDAQPIEGALREFASQANLQLVYETAEVSPNIRSSHVAGAFTAEAALSRLLAHTNLDYKFINDRTVSIRSADSASQARAHLGIESAPRDAHPRLARSESAEVADGPSEQSVATDVTTQSDVRQSALRKGMEEVVVTAQKREERLIDVPISIVALSADELKKREITRLDDLSMVVPGLAVENGGGSRRIQIRGISNLAGSNLPLVGLYLDEADVTSAVYTQLDLNIYDLERVEVLRGPQGTLYGEGSAGGTIRFIAKNPVLDRFTLDADAAAMFTQDGAPGQRIDAALNVPLIANELGLRIASTFDHEGGWIDQPAADQKDINGQNLADVRVKGLWQPTSQFKASAMAEIHRNTEGADIGEDDNGNYTQSFNLTTTPRIEDDFDIYNLTLSYDFASVRLLNTTSYVDEDRESRNIGFVAQITPPVSPLFHILQTPLTDKVSTLTEEFRLTSLGSGPWQWTAGFFYRHFKFDLNNINYDGFPGPPGTPLPAPFPVKINNSSESKSVFGDTSYRLTDRLTLGAGVRYFKDDQEYTTGSPPSTQTGTFHSVDPRAYVQYKLANQINVYASAAKGFRSGGFNPLGQPTYGPEDVWTYELGTKMSLLGARLSIDTDVFYSDYSNYQITGFLPPPAPLVDIYSNAGSARIKGIEWDLTWRPVDQWTLSFNGDYLDTRFYKINATTTDNVVGDELDFVPKYSMTVSAQRDFTVYGNKAAFVRLDYNRKGRETDRLRTIGPWFYGQSDVINMLNFNIGLQWNEQLSLGLIAQNLLNDRGFTDPLSIENLAPRSRPRSIGIQFGVKFD